MDTPFWSALLQHQQQQVVAVDVVLYLFCRWHRIFWSTRFFVRTCPFPPNFSHFARLSEFSVTDVQIAQETFSQPARRPWLPLTSRARGSQLTVDPWVTESDLLLLLPPKTTITTTTTTTTTLSLLTTLLTFLPNTARRSLVVFPATCCCWIIIAPSAPCLAFIGRVVTSFSPRRRKWQSSYWLPILAIDGPKVIHGMIIMIHACFGFVMPACWLPRWWLWNEKRMDQREAFSYCRDHKRKNGKDGCSGLLYW